ncbi:putative related to integral membrane protein PTH11 [Rosellinia necatrix]|uniref:Putative related to integral membrane protein PTH11 n=1 Tax=Rosellinia necatrix TaxID=77044 RepID=A0A1S7UMA7_ROSNE|nr:putative related to integral membrane protein PTH11 [Rosellinia necatrix]
MTVDAEPWVLLSLGIAFVLLRLYARWSKVGFREFQLDDYLMIVFILGFAADNTLAYTVGALFQGLTNSYMTDAQRASLAPDSLEYNNRQWGSKIQVAGWSVYVFNLWVVKFSFAVFFSRLTSGIRHLRIRVYIAYALLAVTYLFVALGLLLSCQPFHHFWQVNPDPGALCQPTNSPFYVLAVLISDVATDLYLVSIPLSLLWGVQIPMRKKVILLTLFGGSFFVIVAGVIRGIVILTAGEEGAVSGSQWANRETFVAAIIGNLPASQPLFRKWAARVGLSGIFSRSDPARGQSHPLSSMDNLNERRAAPDSHYRGTAWARDESPSGDTESPPATKVFDENPNNIVVTHDFTVKSEYLKGKQAPR